MDTTIRQALAKTSTPPQDSTTKEIIGTITEFIEKYGIYLKNGTLLKFKIQTCPNPNGGCNFKLLPPNEDYGNFATVYESSMSHIGHASLANLLKNSGANIVSADIISENEPQRYEYLVEFVVN